MSLEENGESKLVQHSSDIEYFLYEANFIFSDEENHNQSTLPNTGVSLGHSTTVVNENNNSTVID